MSRGSRPLSNVWLGTSVENDDVAFRRIYHLMKCKHWNTFLSMEPLLERVSLSFSYAKTWLDEDCNCHGRVDVLGDTPYGVDWVIVGGESGRNARPFRTEWARLLIVECRYAKTPIFIKQLGSNCIDVDGVTGKGTDPEQWPDDIRIQEFPER